MEFSRNWLTDVPREDRRECFGGLRKLRDGWEDRLSARAAAEALAGKAFKTSANGDIVLIIESYYKCTLNGKEYNRPQAKKLVQMMDEMGWPCTWEQEVKPALKTWLMM